MPIRIQPLRRKTFVDCHPNYQMSLKFIASTTIHSTILILFGPVMRRSSFTITSLTGWNQWKTEMTLITNERKWPSQICHSTWMLNCGIAYHHPSFILERLLNFEFYIFRLPLHISVDSITKFHPHCTSCSLLFIHFNVVWSTLLLLSRLKKKHIHFCWILFLRCECVLLLCNLNRTRKMSPNETI